MGLMGLMAQVSEVFGAGKVFGWGPAPRNGHLRFPVAQVLPFFPHLRHLHPTPAPWALPGWWRVAKWGAQRGMGRNFGGFGGITKIIVIFADSEGGDRVTVVGYFLMLD